MGNSFSSNSDKQTESDPGTYRSQLSKGVSLRRNHRSNSSRGKRSFSSLRGEYAIPSETNPEDDDQMFRWIKDRKFHNSNSLYTLPSDTEEFDRMAINHMAIKFIFGIYHPTVKDALRNANILDIGCGSGTWTIDIARDFPSSVVLGIDMLDVFHEEKNGNVPSNCRFELGNVLDGLDYPNESFDFLHMRHLALCWTEADWPKVLKELLRLVRPGGYVQLVEVDYEIVRPGPVSKSLYNREREMFRERGIVPNIARKLDTMLMEAGFEDVRTIRKSVPNGIWGGKIGSLLKQDSFKLIESARTITMTTGLTDAQFDIVINRMKDEFEEYRSYTMFYMFVGRKPGWVEVTENQENDF